MNWVALSAYATAGGNGAARNPRRAVVYPEIIWACTFMVRATGNRYSEGSIN
jgi:hypothetical protein